MNCSYTRPFDPVDRIQVVLVQLRRGSPLDVQNVAALVPNDHVQPEDLVSGVDLRGGLKLDVLHFVDREIPGKQLRSQPDQFQHLRPNDLEVRVGVEEEPPVEVLPLL